ncbi:MAG: M14 family metallopeptidase [bacterium]|nr:M14 family metallopeptidase [bacterium]
MIESITSIGLPVDEQLEIKKRRILPKGYPKMTEGRPKRICIVTGIHGDELEGQSVCFDLGRTIIQNMENLDGIVDLYPAINPLGIDSITRGIPGFDLDMNRVFPGDSEGTMTEYIASQIIEDLKDADFCIDIHASNIFLTELPQIRINEKTKEQLVPYARHLNMDFIWIHGAATVLESTLAYSLNSIQVPTLVVEMGVGMRITKEYTKQLVDGILALMKELGMWKGTTITPREPLMAKEEQVQFINAKEAGIFIKKAEIGSNVKQGERLGQIVDPLHLVVVEEIYAPCNGVLFTIREYPVVDEGSLIARILEV